MAKPKPARKPPAQVIHGALAPGGYAPVLLVRAGRVTDLRVPERKAAT